MRFSLALVLGILVQGNFSASILEKSNARRSPFSPDPGFPIQKVASLARSLPSHSWEFGTAAETLLELYDPSISVFGSLPFSSTPSYLKSRPGKIQALEYAKNVIVLGSGVNALADGDGAVGDPASLGVSAVLLGDYLSGKEGEVYLHAAEEEIDFIVNQAPRWENGAISHRIEEPQLWSDFMYMAPPFLAYYAVYTSNFTVLQDAVRQGLLYRQVLQTSRTGLWAHIVGDRPVTPDPGLWSTGNAWAAAGMTRMLALVVNKLPSSALGKHVSKKWRNDAVDDLTTWIQEIVDGAIKSPRDPANGLLRNYLDDTSGDGHGFGEISGSCLIASVIYRMAVLQSDIFAPHAAVHGKPRGFEERNNNRGQGKYLDFADSIRNIIGEKHGQVYRHITTNGTVVPAVNPLGWDDTQPYLAGSPEGQNFAVLMYAAWRDCVRAGVCK